MRSYYFYREILIRDGIKKSETVSIYPTYDQAKDMMETSISWFSGLSKNEPEEIEGDLYLTLNNGDRVKWTIEEVPEEQIVYMPPDETEVAV